MAAAVTVATIFACATTSIALAPTRSSLPSAAPRSLGDQQHFWIVRHADKYSSYPACSPGTLEKICFDEAVMGNNPPITECGVEQAEVTTNHLVDEAEKVGGINQILVSPFARTLQTSLPLARQLDLKLKVEYLLSEAHQPQGPFREFNVLLDDETKKQLEEVSERWDLGYGSVPIRTPEQPELYVERVAETTRVLKKRFPPSTGNTVIFTHATTAFSVAYGLCHGGDSSEETLQDFVRKQDAIAPAGLIHVVLDGDGKCLQLDQTLNVATEATTCGRTEPRKCRFEDYPAWYWASSQGAGPGLCH